MQKAAKLGHAILLKLSSFVSDEGLQTWRYFDVCEIVPKSCQFFDSASRVRIDACLVFFLKYSGFKYYAKCFFWLHRNAQRYKERVFFMGVFEKESLIHVSKCDQIQACHPKSNLLNASSQILLINKGQIAGDT